jgi:hypothetical protein
MGQLSTIKKNCEKAGHNNLRTFIYICDLFFEIFNFVTRRYKQNKDIVLEKYFHSLLILLLEQKLGNEGHFDTDLKSFEKRQIFLKETKEGDRYLLNFKNKYITMSGLEFNWYDEIVDLIRYGIFDEVRSEKTIKEIIKIANRIKEFSSGDVKYEALNTIKNYRKYTQEELLDCTDKILSFVKDREYSTDDYSEIYYIFESLISKDIYKTKNLDEIKNIIGQGYIKSFKEIPEDDKEIIIDNMHEAIKNKEVSRTDNFIEYLNTLLREHGKKAKINKDKQDIIDIFNAMKDKDDNAFINAYNLFDKRFFEVIINTNSLDLLDNMEIRNIYWLEEILKDMLNTSNMLDVYSEQKAYIEKTLVYIKDTMNKENDSFRKTRLNDLIGLFEKVLEKFS